MNLIQQLEHNPIARLAIIAAIEIAVDAHDSHDVLKYGEASMNLLKEMWTELGSNTLTFQTPTNSGLGVKCDAFTGQPIKKF